MNLARGAKLGPYEIGMPLGADGMGELYRATDTRDLRCACFACVSSAGAAHKAKSPASTQGVAQAETVEQKPGLG